eukprot:TRINITY_DN16627_c0_g2_i1.p1 TRINITY_DN16627_c0_g2~~TRINITY_DN16627_c0_g2_i1.p1  ORF type:complete len:463 (+),score=120.05 TRINITY_DN16627_c0_g2_i1:87-1391(+)
MRALLACASAVGAAAVPRGDTIAPGPLPAFSTWVVLSAQFNDAGNVSQLWSVGQNIQSSTAQNSLCVYNQKVLTPARGPNTTEYLANYTEGVLYSHNVADATGKDTCKQQKLKQGTIPYNDIWWLSPNPEERKAMKMVAEGVPCDTDVCNQWQYVGPMKPDGSHCELFWFVTVNGSIPMIFQNQTIYANNSFTMLTAAYDGNHPQQDFGSDCIALRSCGPLHCVADPEASDTAVGSGVSWACGDGGVDCSAVNPSGEDYYPNTVHAHGNYVFDQYFQAHASGGSGACNFGGAAKLVHCKGSCTTCNASMTATEEQMQNALKWVCGPDGIQDCTYPAGVGNSTREQLNWAMNKYYQAYQCSNPKDACSFSGIGVVTPCGATMPPTPAPKPTPAPPTPPPTPEPTYPPDAKFVCNDGQCQRYPYGANYTACKATCK